MTKKIKFALLVAIVAFAALFCSGCADKKEAVKDHSAEIGERILSKEDMKVLKNFLCPATEDTVKVLGAFMPECKQKVKVKTTKDYVETTGELVMNKGLLHQETVDGLKIRVYIDGYFEAQEWDPMQKEYVMIVSQFVGENDDLSELISL